MRLTADEVERFWSKVEKTDDHWMWRGSRFGDGYGEFIVWRNVKRVKLRAHRVAWELHYGRELGRLCGLHSCDIPLCVRPTHIFPGTRTDNSADMMAKGRHNSGRKLTEEQLEQIRAGAESQADLARRFGVDPSTITRAKQRMNSGV